MRSGWCTQAKSQMSIYLTLDSWWTQWKNQNIPKQTKLKPAHFFVWHFLRKLLLEDSNDHVNHLAKSASPWKHIGKAQVIRQRSDAVQEGFLPNAIDGRLDHDLPSWNKRELYQAGTNENSNNKPDPSLSRTFQNSVDVWVLVRRWGRIIMRWCIVDFARSFCRNLTS